MSEKKQAEKSHKELIREALLLRLREETDRAARVLSCEVGRLTEGYAGNGTERDAVKLLERMADGLRKLEASRKALDNVLTCYQMNRPAPASPPSREGA